MQFFVAISVSGVGCCSRSRCIIANCANLLNGRIDGKKSKVGCARMLVSCSEILITGWKSLGKERCKRAIRIEWPMNQFRYRKSDAMFINYLRHRQIMFVCVCVEHDFYNLVARNERLFV